MLHRVGCDLRFALRQFARRPGFAVTAVFVLALGLGANTAIFSVVNALLLRPLPYPHAERIVALNEVMHGKGGAEGASLSPGNYLDWRAQSTSFDEIAASINRPANLSSDKQDFEPQRVGVCHCSANFSSLLGISPIIGRAMRPDWLARDAVEYVEKTLLAGLCHRLDRASIDRDIRQYRRRGNVHVPQRMVHKLAVPLALTRLQVDAHERLTEEIISWTMATIIVAGRRLVFRTEA